VRESGRIRLEEYANQYIRPTSPEAMLFQQGASDRRRVTKDRAIDLRRVYPPPAPCEPSMVIMGEPKLRRCLSRDTEDKVLPIVKPL